MKKYVLVTGGAGYIGSHTIVEIFKNTEFDVLSIDNYSNSYPEVYINISQIVKKEVIPIEVDLCDKNLLFEKIQPYCESIIGIIHFAAYKSVPESVTNPIVYYHNNIQSLLNILEFSHKYHIDNFIFSSSCSVYGDIKTSPVTENTLLLSPNSQYAHTKQIGEEILYHLVHTSHWPLKVLSLRYFNPVGAHVSGLIGEYPKYNLTGLFPNLILSALGKSLVFQIYGNDYNTKDGTPVRDYIHVSDIAFAHVLALQKMQSLKMSSHYDVLNLGTGNGYTVLEVIRAFEKIAKVKINYEVTSRRHGDVECIYANNDKAKKEINWSPQYTLDDMVATSWQWGKKVYLNLKSH